MRAIGDVTANIEGSKRENQGGTARDRDGEETTLAARGHGGDIRKADVKGTSRSCKEKVDES